MTFLGSVDEVSAFTDHSVVVSNTDVFSVGDTIGIMVDSVTFLEPGNAVEDVLSYDE